MVGFANIARKQGVLLYEQPYYRQNKKDALKTFSQKAASEYANGGAATIRNARFGNSNEYNVNMALKNKREKIIAASADNYGKDPKQNVGIHARLGLNLTNTGGALSRYQIPGVTRGKVNRGGSQPAMQKGAAQAPVAGQAMQAAPHGAPVAAAVAAPPAAKPAAQPLAPHGTPTSATLALYDRPPGPYSGITNVALSPAFQAMLDSGRTSTGGMEHFSPSARTPARSSGRGAGLPEMSAPGRPLVIQPIRRQSLRRQSIRPSIKNRKDRETLLRTTPPAPTKRQL